MLLAVDANNLLHRAYHAVPPMSAPDGTPSNALRGFLNSVLNLQEQTGANQVVCAFDGGIPIIRAKAAPSYKANRPPKDEALQVQLALALSKLAPAMGWGCICEPRTEADDILYTLCLRAKESNTPIAVASGDKDTAQCLEISPDSLLLRPPKKSGEEWDEITPNQVKTLLGIPPHQVADFLAITGDNSDNLPGVSGAGPATAIKWLETYETLQNLLENIETLEPKRFRDKILPAQLRANLIVTKGYDTGHQIPEPTPKSPELEEILRSLGLFKLIRRATNPPRPPNPKQQPREQREDPNAKTSESQQAFLF